MQRLMGIVRVLTVLGCAAAALLLPAPGAGATSTETIHLLGDCIVDNNDTGAITVSAGSHVVVANPGWATGTYGGAQVFRRNQTTTETVATDTGQTTVDLTNTWSAPVFIATTNPGLGFWVVHEASTDLGQLAAGQTVVLTWVLQLDRPTLLAYPPVGSTGGNGPALLAGEVDSPLTCSVTAS